LWKYAAAAVITGVIATSSIWMMNRADDNNGNTDVAVEISTVSMQIAEAQKYKSETQIHNEIASLPEEEILQYLQKTATDDDLDLIASSINTTTLPEQQDYLLDEQALDKYLQIIDSENNKN
jgi:hypothetical protein